MYCCHLFLISSASVRSIPFLTIIEPICMKCSLGISSFLEEISSLSPSIDFLCFFALITESGFIISPCYSLELCIQMGISLPPPWHYSQSSKILNLLSVMAPKLDLVMVTLFLSPREAVDTKVSCITVYKFSFSTFMKGKSKKLNIQKKILLYTVFFEKFK